MAMAERGFTAKASVTVDDSPPFTYPPSVYNSNLSLSMEETQLTGLAMVLQHLGQTEDGVYDKL